MLVPATAEDLRAGGKIVVKNENDNNESQVILKVPFKKKILL